MAHRQADGREYHPLLRFSDVPQFSSHVAVWAAMSAGDEDAVVRWDFCRLDFFGTFCIKTKSTKEIINMNGRLYDPVIGRFFSPDKFVANSSFTQDIQKKLI
jgi:hypothetical protein